MDLSSQAAGRGFCNIVPRDAMSNYITHPGKKRAVTIGGKTYQSLSAYARENGFSPNGVYKAFRRVALEGYTGSCHRVNMELLWAAARQPCSAHGYSWASQAECAKFLGIGQSYVCEVLREGKFEDMVARRLRKLGLAN